MNKNPFIVCLMGPTASGKTDLAIALARKLPFEIISVDSAMVYRGLDIGTAKPNEEELQLTSHRLINICDPSFPYSAGQFYKDALSEIKTIEIRNRTPLLVGGTMLYFHILEQGFSDLPTADETVRKKIQEEAAQHGWAKIHERLNAIDPKSAARINPNDAQRIQRAFEVYETTGQPLSSYQSLKRFKALPYQFINLILAPENRSWLHQRIEKRFDQMLKNNFLEEVRQLYNRGDLNSDLPAIRTVGYRQVWKYLSGEYDYETMRHKAIAATRQLAKRQLTWLRRWPDAKWFNSEDKDLISQVVDYLKGIGM
ncbi:tRNA (adenosine(37)-N6)-dimethylallyltransferase MiaA [Coxiella burnetii]|uniref:tRNA dimethylallyltransferase n=5 Tax=Coxiella burnetii TaxID=777 RepID=MIAA_COXBU|nr:tRNA (adenosine(37)-N6)-dimethylallyltransferase MiaA [Coxiella burnetii]NP_820081.1 tRNA delta(2)-isopentenylpyrophosphate transferase [Coxiella burnetii RSA 493]A9KE31.1 RecName: Full=tRNA dimethylallyltransferase; AltName: Full=Dimethylallyl diphosphate:tRNA dimethylallyltransferase; Short=DMAPP:tRNA dimethylallyltransferase; Short=DMATase; AltName: Full=Isopentenyl-diphosphate:tRNA isopentenyltransferase; Short=IPP transferase; Short=IPPT; Short=IPTase [Coxiella burnetii Dugway 5J108-111]